MRKRGDMNELDELAEEIYDHACANRADNLKKDGSAGDPRGVGCKFKDLFDNAKNFYRSIAKWHLSKTNEPKT